MTTPSRVPAPPIALGLAGLLPQALCVLLALGRTDSRLAAGVAGGGYAALILSFLGGMWWMQALARGEARWWPYLLAVTPSLIAWAALLAALSGVVAPGMALIVLAVALLVSPASDRMVGPLWHDSAGWRRLRLVLSGGLGLLTLVLAALAGRG